MLCAASMSRSSEYPQCAQTWDLIESVLGTTSPQRERRWLVCWAGTLITA
jgi:hypothetical protein